MKLKLSRQFAFVATLIVGTTTLQAEKAYAYDMDCKVILCIAGGFPSGCSDAYRYMIKRITRFPKPLSPFGFCAMSDGTEYKAHNVDYRFLGNGPDAFDCPQGKQLYYRRDNSDHGGWGNETAFCYSHSASQRTGWGRDTEYQTVYHNQSLANRVNFQLMITIEPGTRHEFRSPLFRINTSTGYVSQRPI
ncbi:MAG: hypothetical protein GY742_10590 [Hyphomicrobiales bacterium]|nr:hypothetical protein [Hyphomicrobiales bacterium]